MFILDTCQVNTITNSYIYYLGGEARKKDSVMETVSAAGIEAYTLFSPETELCQNNTHLKRGEWIERLREGWAIYRHWGRQPIFGVLCNKKMYNFFKSFRQLTAGLGRKYWLINIFNRLGLRIRKKDRTESLNLPTNA